MTTKEIVEAVVSYVRDENEKYAILIDGAWGSGKTYLYENYLVDAINSIESGKNGRKRNVYISLYGISSIDALSKQLLANYYIYVKGNGNRLIKKGLKPVAGLIGVVSSAFSFSVGPVKTDLTGALNKIQGLLNVKDMILCFDDLERCAIPINELFGLINNLVEHCNCKVILLADERNIGKIYANTNLEGKYLTVLSGNRKVVQYKKEAERKNNETENHDGEISVEEVKKLNEILYSENYIYKDIKEKVIGKTLFYYPKLDEVISDLINGNKKCKSLIPDGQYKDYLNTHKDGIIRAFSETKNHNLRIIKIWLLSFKKIFDTTTTYFAKDKFYEDVLDEFVRYSIWVIGALKKNKKITPSAMHGSRNLVFFEGNEYTYIHKYEFIDSWIKRDVWDDAELNKACNDIIKRKEREEIEHPPRIQSTGVELGKLRSWHLMGDGQVKQALANLEQEITENKYAFYDYSNILIILLHLEEYKLYTGNIESIKDVMIDLIKLDKVYQENDRFPKSFSSEAMRKKYYDLYTPIAEEREKRNREINNEEQEGADIYRNAKAFCAHCRKMEDYYCRHKSFTEYLNIEKLYELIDKSDNEGIYSIQDAFKTVYYMGNLKDFYLADVENLKTIRKNILDERIVKKGGITRKIALNSLANAIKEALMLLGAEENEM